jgi:hypothetical protein
MPGGPQPPVRAGAPLPFRGRDFSGGGYQHQPGNPGRNPHRGRYRGRDHDRRYHGRGSYGYYPGYYVYPYVVDPGFYDWGATDYSENEQGFNESAPPEQGPDQGPDNGPEPPYPDYGATPYPQQPPQNSAPATAPAGAQRQEYHFATTAPSAPSPITSKPLTVIFKGGRAPQKIQNYMVTSNTLTNLDGENFEKIPLDQIDIAATQQANRSNGIDFQVPVASRD